MSDQFSEQDLREATEFIERRLKDKIAMHAWINSLAAEFRREARAGMREACAKAQSFFEQHSPVLWEDSWRCRCSRWALDRKLNTVEQADKSRAIHLAEEWEEHIRALPDLAADEAIERIKREARLSLTADLAAMVNYRYLLRDVTERLLKYAGNVYPRCPEDSEQELEAAEERKALIADAKTILYETGIAALGGKET